VIARFFIDRPIFAVVISLVIVLAGGVALTTLPITQYPNVTPPAVLVSTVYPGANASTVRDTVAAPIEEQVSGVEGMLYMSSRCTNDGAYNLLVTFKPGTNSDMAQVLVQNRVSLALPVIPQLVQTEGLSVKKTTPTTMMIVNLVSPDHRFDATFLSNYATIYLKDELGRVPGVADITYFGKRDYSMRAWLDPDKLAALNSTPGDVVTAIAQQNLQVAAGQIGQPPKPSRAQQFQLTINTLGRLSDPAQFGAIIIKAAQGQTTSTGTNPSPSTAPPGATVAGTSGPMSQQSMAANMNGPTPPVTGLVRLRDVVRDDMFVIRLRFDPAKLAARGLRADAVIDALQPKPISIKEDPGTKPENGQSLTWLATYTGIDPPSGLQLAATEIKSGPGEPLHLGDLMMEGGIEHRSELDQLGVQLGSQQYEQTCTLDGQPSVAMSIFQLPGSNALNTAQGVYAKMDDLKTHFPSGMDYRIVYDTTPFIRESVEEVFVTLRDAVILVAIVVLLFLQDWKAMILPMIDVPVSLIGTFAIMSLLGFTLNNLTLFGLVLAIGIVVDDAIVVLENIERQIATGLEVRAATIKAMDEITGPVLAITLVLSSVFIPCCFLGGITGQFFRQFAVTIAVSTIISAINALTMTPSRAVLIFKNEQAANHESSEAGHGHGLPAKEALPWWIFGVGGGFLSVWLAQRFLAVRFPGVLEDWSIDQMVAFIPGAVVGGLVGWLIIRPVNVVLALFFGIFNWFFDRLTAFYGAIVSGFLRVSLFVLLLYVGLLGLTGWEMAVVPTGFIPEQDKGYVLLNVQLPDAAAVERTERIMARIEQIARDTPGVEHTVGVSGQSLILNANAPNLGSLYVLMKPAAAIGAAIVAHCRTEVRGAIVQAFGAPPVEGLGTTGGFKIIIEDRGNLGLKELQQVGDRISARANQSRELEGVFNGSRVDTPWLYLDIDRSQCLALGVQISDVFNTLQYYMGSYYVNNFNEFGRTWQVNVQADQHFRDRVDDLLSLQVRNNQGQMIRLGTVMDVRDTSGPVAVLRYNLYSSTAITGNPAPGASSGEAAKAMQTIVSEEMPRSMAYDWTELMYLQLQAGNSALYAFALAVAFVFLVLAAQYESWTLPLAIILVVPMCLLSSIVGMQLERMEVTIFTQIGFVVLVGLASKNAILIVEFARQQQEAGMPLREAVKEASRLRLRPILMTSFAFIFGVVPLVIAHGAGAEMRRSLGVAVFSGMVGVTLFGVFLTPVFYYLIQRFLAKAPVGPVDQNVMQSRSRDPGL
jgi:multidrug efflux pump